MINKIKNKKDRIVLIENKIKKYFKREYNIDLFHEVNIYNETPDLIGIIKENNTIKYVIVVEIKQSIFDFYSGHSLNFIGVSNYLAVPSKLICFAIIFLRNNLKRDFDIGILEITNFRDIRIVIYPRKYKNNYFINITAT